MGLWALKSHRPELESQLCHSTAVKALHLYSLSFPFCKLRLVAPAHCAMRIKLDRHCKLALIVWPVSNAQSLFAGIIMPHMFISSTISGSTEHALGSNLISQDTPFQEILSPDCGRIWGSPCLGCCHKLKSLPSFLKQRNLLQKSCQFCASGPHISDSFWAWQFDLRCVCACV